MLNVVNISGRLYISLEQIQEFNRRAASGEFARAVKAPGSPVDYVASPIPAGTTAFSPPVTQSVFHKPTNDPKANGRKLSMEIDKQSGKKTRTTTPIIPEPTQEVQDAPATETATLTSVDPTAVESYKSCFENRMHQSSQSRSIEQMSRTAHERKH
jgi:hypothetical protein